MDLIEKEVENNNDDESNAIILSFTLTEEQIYIIKYWMRVNVKRAKQRIIHDKNIIEKIDYKNF